MTPGSRIGITMIGTGYWAGKLGEAMPKTGLELVSCYSRSAERSAEFAARFGCTALATLDEAIESADAVVLATPNAEHAEQALAAAAAGKHVFVEKPIATTIADGERMREACDRAGVALYVGHEMRHLGAARAAKKLADEGALGTIVLAESNFSIPSAVKPGTWKTGSGTPLVQLGIHHADTLQYLLGPVARTTGRLSHFVSSADIDDVGVAVLEFESGPLGVIASSYVTPKTYSLRLHGTEGVLDYRIDMSVWPATERLDPLTTLTLAGEEVAFDHVEPLADELADFARCVAGEATPETGAAEGIAALTVILDAIETADAE